MAVKAMGCLILAGLWATSQPGYAEQCTTPATPQARQEANKKLAAEFFRKGITLEERLALLHPDYVQHDPNFQRFNEVNGLHGSRGFEAMIKSLHANGPPPEPPAGNDPTFMILAEGDLVTIVQRRMLPDPQDAGKTYEGFWFETWRVKDCKLYEHWDPAVLADKK